MIVGGATYDLAWPWALAAGVLPALVAYLAPRVRPARGEALRFPFLDQLETVGVLKRPARGGWRRWLGGAAWCLLVLAATRPQAVGSPYSLPLTGRDLMLAIDLSTSMDTRDLRIDEVPVTRLEAVQHVVGEFVGRRVGDRVGLLVFGSKPYLQTPLTFDRTMVRTQLQEAMSGMAGPLTALGDVIGLATKHLMHEPSARRVLILVSDGRNTAGETHPLDAAEVARANGLVIYTVGLGTELSAEQQRELGSNLLGRSLDEPTLRAIAERTGGRYFRGNDLPGLEGIYDELDRIEPTARPSDVVRPVREFYPWPLAAASALALAVLLGPHLEGVLRSLVARARAACRRWLTSFS